MVKIHGIKNIKVLKNEQFDISVHLDIQTGITYTVKWYDDKNLDNLIGIGEKITLTSSSFHDGDKLYVNVYSDTNEQLLNELFIINIDIIDEYHYIDDRFYNDKYIDIDSMYFKFHKAFSGICYMYIRDVDNIYEQNILVSDKSLTGAYNAYNEFDIIDEYFSNVYEAEVAIDKNLNISLPQNVLDGSIMRKGTRVLLFKQNDITENGVYQINENNMLIRTDELDTVDKLFRYKIHINSGKYLDDEFHVIGYYKNN
jgi:hypothetical protein